jgi:hypothetical protein
MISGKHLLSALIVASVVVSGLLAAFAAQPAEPKKKKRQ